MKVVVVGAGVFGSWSAKFLADAGHQVTLLDAYGPANGRASSADYTRVIRAGYGADEIYSRWATESLQDWQWLCEATGQSLLARTGALFMGEPGNQYVLDTHRTLHGLGIEVELFEPERLHRQYPQISVARLGPTVFEPHAGVIRARVAVQALVGLLARSSTVAYSQIQVGRLDEQRASCVLVDGHGRTLPADAYVIACGPWLSKILPFAVGRRVRATRQEVLYFGVPPRGAVFSASRLPVWIDFAAGVYGVADLDALGFKVGIDRHGPEIDPDTLDRFVDADLVTRTRAWLGGRFPGLEDAPLVDARVCQYENTSSGDFILDRHPAWQNCWIVGGGSGHGFKHGPAVGRYVAALLDQSVEVNERFSLGAKSTRAARAIF
jgi:sarcosine oxidase